jgi:ribonuclease P protein component
MRGFFRIFKKMKTFGFGKAEKLKSRKRIDALFAEGRGFAAFPVRVKYVFSPLQEGATPVQAGVSVSRKAFKQAVDRNRIKRLLREAYRLQKPDLLKSIAAKGLRLEVFFLYTDKALPSFDVISDAMKKCLGQLQQKATRYHENPD